MSRITTLPWLLVALCVGCGARPARFADAPPVTRVADDMPIPVPEQTSVIGPVYSSEVYVRRPIVFALEARRVHGAQDINALDDVPPSSWYSPPALDAAAFARAYEHEGAPEPPWTIVRAPSDGPVEARDARGVHYEIRPDPRDRPHTASAAAAIATRLVRGLGYRTVPTWVQTADPSRISGAVPAALSNSAVWQVTRWPLGIYVGPTDPSNRRRDDPNDRVEPTRRRTLRVLGLLAAWLEIPNFGPERLADVYVGLPGQGHVQHFVVGLSASLGAAALATYDPVVSAAGTVKGTIGWNLITLGLHRPDEYAQQTSLTVFRPTLERSHTLSMPYDPSDHLLPGDGYWFAKRLLRITNAFIMRAIDEARVPDAALVRHLRSAIAARRDQLIARLMTSVTPCEVATITPELLSLSDTALGTGMESRVGSAYRITFMDLAGDPLMQTLRQSDSLGEIDIALPHAIRQRDYTVVEVHAERRGQLVPKAMVLHLAARGGTPRVIGLRH
jgi:hypothetical protein